MVLIGLSLLLPHPEPSLPASLHALFGRLAECRRGPAKGGVGVGVPVDWSRLLWRQSRRGLQLV